MQCWLFTSTNSTPLCYIYKYNQFQCRSPSTCQQAVNTSSCICPIDRDSTDCSEFREIECNATLLSPRLVCDNEYYKDKNDPKAHLLDSDPACLVYTLAETVKLQYRIDCAFAKPSAISQKILDANFTYWLSNANVRIFLNLRLNQVLV